MCTRSCVIWAIKKKKKLKFVLPDFAKLQQQNFQSFCLKLGVTIYIEVCRYV